MARPIKQTVDYFPHLVNKGKTKLILQNEFGNDGYAFWFQLLELLCLTDNQVYDYNNSASWRLLLAETHVTEDNAIKILQLLADLGAIDSKLHKNKIIWSQNLVDNLELVYKRRATGTPVKPVIANKNPVNVNIRPHTKQDKTKQDKTILPEFIDKEIWDDYLETRKKKRAVPTERAKVLLIKKVEELRDAGDDPNEVLKRSIMNGWTGIFPLDKKGGQSGTHKQSSRRLPKVYRSREEIYGKDG